MKKAILILLLCGAGYGQVDTLLLIGNSIASGANAALIVSMRAKGEAFLNRGVGGSILTGTLATLTADLNACHPKAVYIMTFTNDMAWRDMDIMWRQLDTLLIRIRQHRADMEIIINDLMPCVYADTQSVGTVYNNSKMTVGGYKLVNSKLAYWCMQNSVKICRSYMRFQDTTWVTPDRMPLAYADDGVHPNALGCQIQAQSISLASIPIELAHDWGSNTYPVYPADTWKTWQKTGTITLAGSDSAGSMVMSTGSSMQSPVVSIGEWDKQVSVATTLESGTCSTYIRFSYAHFFRSDTATRWIPYTSTIDTNALFCQIKIVNSSGSSSTIANAKLSWEQISAIGHQQKVSFGNRPGMVRINNKDTWVSSIGGNSSNTFGHDVWLSCVQAGNNHAYPLFRYNINNIIKPGATIDSAKMHLYFYSANGSIGLCSLSRVNKPFGLTNEWDEYGGVNDGYGQASYLHSRGDPIGWATDSFTSLDYYSSPSATFSYTANLQHREYIVNVTNDIQSLSDSNTTFYGWVLNAFGIWEQFTSQQYSNVNYRPYLEVWYNADSTTIINTIIDSIIFDNVKIPTFTQTGNTLQFTPLSPVMWSRDSYPMVIYTGANSYRYDIKFKKSGGALGSLLTIRVSTGF